MKRLNVSINDDLHKILKVTVAEQGTTIGNYVVAALEEKVAKDNAEKQEVAENKE